MNKIFIIALLLLTAHSKIITDFQNIVLDAPRFRQTSGQKTQDSKTSSFTLFPVFDHDESVNGSLSQALFAESSDKEYIYNEPDYVVTKKTERPPTLFYVQGFKFFDSNTILESAGLYGESAIQLLDSFSFEVKKEVKMDDKYFGEGSDWIINKNGEKEIHQMTYKERKVFVYDSDLNVKKEFELPKEFWEGWGLARFEDENGNHMFYATDGTDRLFVIDPETWTIQKTMNVRDQNGKTQNKLNELVLIDGKLFINIYLSSKIAQVDPKTAKVLKQYDFQTLVDEFESSSIFTQNGFNRGHCLNGIAYNSENDRLLITGKKWNFVYEIKLKNVV